MHTIRIADLPRDAVETVQRLIADEERRCEEDDEKQDAKKRRSAA